MNNRNPLVVIAIYTLVVSIFYSIVVTPLGDNFVLADFLKTGLIAWGITFVTAYILHLMVYPRNAEQLEQMAFTPSVQYFYNDYCNGFCRVEKITMTEQGQILSEFNFLNKEGNYISEKWYPAVSDFCEEGTALVTDGEMYNFINTEGNIVCNNWFYGIEPFVNGIAKVRWKDNTVNFVTTEGKYLWEDWRPEIVLNKEEDSNNIE